MATRPDASAAELNHSRLEELFEELDDELGKAGASGELYVIGGARMAYGLNPARRTMDIDAVFRSGRNAIRKAAATVREKHKLPSGWLNEGAAGMLPTTTDNHEVPLFSGKNLKVQGASPERMLTLKVCSLRDKDWKDIKPLMTATGATTFEKIEKLVRNEYHDTEPGAAMLLTLRLPTLKDGLDQGKHEAAWQNEINAFAPPSRALGRATGRADRRSEHDGTDGPDRTCRGTQMVQQPGTGQAVVRRKGQPVGGNKPQTGSKQPTKDPGRGD